MKIKFHGSYRNAKGTLVHRYLVSGTEEQLAEYKNVQGDNYRANEAGVPLFFTVNPIGNSGTLSLNKKGVFTAISSDTTSAMAIASAKQFGAEVTAAVAARIADKLMSGISAPAAVEVAEPAAKL